MALFRNIVSYPFKILGWIFMVMAIFFAVLRILSVSGVKDTKDFAEIVRDMIKREIDFFDRQVKQFGENE